MAIGVRQYSTIVTNSGKNVKRTTGLLRQQDAGTPGQQDYYGNWTPGHRDSRTTTATGCQDTGTTGLRQRTAGQEDVLSFSRPPVLCRSPVVPVSWSPVAVVVLLSVVLESSRCLVVLASRHPGVLSLSSCCPFDIFSGICYYGGILANAYCQIIKPNP